MTQQIFNPLGPKRKNLKYSENTKKNCKNDLKK